MTDKQIACTYIAHRIWGMCPDHDELRSIADQKLSEERCYKIVQKITEMAEKMRQPLIDHLNRSGLSAT